MSRYCIYFSYLDNNNVLLLNDNYIRLLLDKEKNMLMLDFSNRSIALWTFFHMTRDEFTRNGMLRLKLVRFFDRQRHSCIKEFFTSSDYIKDVLKIK